MIRIAMVCVLVAGCLSSDPGPGVDAPAYAYECCERAWLLAEGCGTQTHSLCVSGRADLVAMLGCDPNVSSCEWSCGYQGRCE